MPLSLERLEDRFTPGGDLISIPLWIGAIHSLGAQVRPRMVEVDPPQADLVLIAASKDGKPTRYLDYSHDVDWGRNTPHDVANVAAAVADIQSASNRVGYAIDVTIVAETTQGDTGVILGNSYLFAASADTKKLIAGTAGKVASVSFLTPYGQQKLPLYQALADGLSAGDEVMVDGYSGYLGIVAGTPAHFVVPSGTTIVSAYSH